MAAVQPHIQRPRSWRKALGCLAFVAFLGLSTPSRADSSFTILTEDEQRRVDQGETVVHMEQGDVVVRQFLVTGMVEASAARVYRAFADFDHYSKIFKIKDSRIIRQDGNVLNVRALLELPWPIGERWVLNETRLEPENYAFTYRRIDGSIAEYTGNVRIVPRTARSCQVYYIAKGDLGIPFIPRWVVDWIQASTLPDTIKHIRAYVKPCCGEDN